MDTHNLQKIKDLLSDASALEKFNEHYKEKYAQDKNCDKHGFGFGNDSRFRAFKIETGFDSYAGYYGNSSCSRILHMRSNDVSTYFVRALNHHQKEIFSTAARLMREEAGARRSAAEKELSSLQQMLAATAEVEPD